MEKWLNILRCPSCHTQLVGCNKGSMGKRPHEDLVCPNCCERFPIIDGIPRLLLPPLREALSGNGIATGIDKLQVSTALSFGFEWSRFPEMHQEWQQSFFNYMQPHQADFFRGKKVLDAGCGNGRFAYYASKYGADVWAIDLGPAVEVARRNTQEVGNVSVIQADIYNLPFAFESFDFIFSIGVLHHLPDPESAFQNLLRYLKPGGEVQIYLYWKPEGQPLKRWLLAFVALGRQVTARLPHAIVHALAFPAAAAAYVLFVWPYTILKRVPGLDRFAEKLPMKQYARFPFSVCVNDQLDRFSAPIENRYTKKEITDWLIRAGLETINIQPLFGWVGSGRKPASAQVK